MNRKCVLPMVQVIVCFTSFETLAFQEQQYNPVVFNMAQLYDFNPVRGNVKELVGTVYNEDKTINYKSVLKIGPDGCVESFWLDQKKDEYLSGVHNYLSIKRVKNKLIGMDANGPVEIAIGKDCNIISRQDTNGKLVYLHNKEGFIIGSVLADTKEKFGENNYNEHKLPTEIKYYKGNSVISETLITYGKDFTKPFDLTMDIRALGQTILLVDSKCDYDKRNIAYQCNFTLTLDSNGKTVKLAKTSKTDVKFY
ncbi:YnfC family lipoprotein [Providencia vermicola]|uniref:YnfC family lipoprotein n=1 Tax=Providencia vermicola TaxID=333965 RepID=UPI001CEDDC03|nr:YnfC family lipoprotein [Providencia vermicola]